MASSDSRTQIIVAVIGLAGVLAAALIANRNQSPARPVGPVTPAPSINRTFDRPVHPQTPKPELTFGDAPDAVMIYKSNVMPGTHLKEGQQADFTVLVRYRLTSLQKATLTVGLVDYRNASGCDTANGDIPTAGHVDVVRGEGTVEVPIQWTVGVSKGVTASGSIGYNAAFWSDFEGRQLFKSFGGLPGYCYQFD